MGRLGSDLENGYGELHDMECSKESLREKYRDSSGLLCGAAIWFRAETEVLEGPGKNVRDGGKVAFLDGVFSEEVKPRAVLRRVRLHNVEFFLI